jgi:GT2 family glycosyltransferase
MERRGAARALHVPEVLYHWRITGESTSGDPARKVYAFEAGRRAIASHLSRKEHAAGVERALRSFYRVRWSLPSVLPTVAVIADGEASSHPTVGRHRLRTRLHAAGAPLGSGGAASRLEAAARQSQSDILLFLGPGSILSASALEELVSQALRPEVGVVGGQIVSPRNGVRHGGYLLDLGPRPRILSAHATLHPDEPGYFGRNGLVQNVAAVSSGALAVRREVFEALGGFDVERFPDRLFDIDFCLRVWQSGLRVVWTPWGRVRDAADGDPHPHRGGPVPGDVERLQHRWSARWSRDPFWHPCLDHDAADFRLAPARKAVAATNPCGSLPWDE